MKTLKIILTILLTIIIVAVGFATEILALTNISLINPWFYEKALSRNGFYENIRPIITNQVNVFIDEQDAIPEEFKESAYLITETVISQEKFSAQMGEFVGGIVSYLLYNKGDAVIPIHTWINDFEDELLNSTFINDIVDSKYDSGEITDKEAYYDALYPVIYSTYTGYFKSITSFLQGSDKVSTFFNMFYAEGAVQNRASALFERFSIWTRWANQGMYAGITVMIILSALLILLWRRNAGFAYKLLGIVLIINSAILIIAGGFMLMSISILDVMNKLPEILVSYKVIVQSGINSFAVLVLIGGAIVLAIGITLSILGGALIRKKEENLTKDVDTIDTQVSEIVYEEKKDENVSVEETE